MYIKLNERLKKETQAILNLNSKEVYVLSFLFYVQLIKDIFLVIRRCR